MPGHLASCYFHIFLLLAKIVSFAITFFRIIPLTFRARTAPCANLKLLIHLQTLCSWMCSENLFFLDLPANEGKMTNQLHRKLRENCWRDRKIFPQIWKRIKIQTNTVPTEPRTSFVFVENTKWFTTNCLQTFCKPRTNYTNSCSRTYFSLVYTQLYVIRKLRTAI